MFHERRQHTICFVKTYERSKKSCRVFLFLRQVQSNQRNGKKLRPAIRRWKSTETFTKKRNDDMKKACRDIKKIIWMKCRILTSIKDAIRQTQKQPQRHVQRQPQRLLGADITFFWGRSLMKWQERIRKTIEVLCQEVEAEKPTKLGDNHSVSSVEQHEKMATERSAVK